ncbi:hypothetical protein FGG08_005385 [Glutinoglossum americanum]|uniref:Uncharacterized protein n=1 Tax=Glutinoglossum americanum TaxID=1670608 RepID=A0A9P8I0G2_9PEZI|nr:hypothetical protein FGG08_005385 [Glutinoglossum americanum]
MPSPQRQVAFAGTTAVSRQPGSRELEVIHNFASHASRCRQCAHPWDVHIEGGILCDRGHRHAQKVAAYFYNQAGKAYSARPRDDGCVPTQIEIPVGCEAVKELLQAMEHGLRIRQPPVITYDRTYPISARVVAPQHPPAQQVIEVVPRRHSQHHHAVARRSEKPYISGRGSLYASDMNDRHRRYRYDSGYYPSSLSAERYHTRDDMVLSGPPRFYP